MSWGRGRYEEVACGNIRSEFKQKLKGKYGIVSDRDTLGNDTFTSADNPSSSRSFGRMKKARDQARLHSDNFTGAGDLLRYDRKRLRTRSAVTSLSKHMSNHGARPSKPPQHCQSMGIWPVFSLKADVLSLLEKCLQRHMSLIFGCNLHI